MPSPPRLLLVGCGKMGGALLAGWQRGELIREAWVIEPAGVPHDSLGKNIRLVGSAEELPDDFVTDLIVLAVKPQMLEQAARPVSALARQGAAVISIAAGKTLDGLQAVFGTAVPIIRVMPNTPAAIGRGASVAVANARVDAALHTLATRMLAAVGLVRWVEDEALLDAVTAVSGSGPAYVFLLIEALAAAGVKAGLPPELAEALARATVSGAGELARESSAKATELRRNVTSPHGTTAAALDVLMAADGLQPLLDRAVAAAARRSRELAG